jgi:hypothetical protein
MTGLTASPMSDAVVRTPNPVTCASGLGVVFVFDVVLLVALAAAVWAKMQASGAGVTGSRKHEKDENTKENWSN